MQRQEKAKKAKQAKLERLKEQAEEKNAATEESVREPAVDLAKTTKTEYHGMYFWICI